MHASLFSLVAAENPDLVFAWGMEIVDGGRQDDEENQKAIVYVGSPNGEGSISTHASAEHACRRWGTIAPLSLVWDADTWANVYRQILTEDSESSVNPDKGADRAETQQSLE